VARGLSGRASDLRSSSRGFVSRGFAVFADAWLSEISTDLITGNDSALEVVLHDYALYKSTFTLLYFTLDVSLIKLLRFVVLVL